MKLELPLSPNRDDWLQHPYTLQLISELEKSEELLRNRLATACSAEPISMEAVVRAYERHKALREQLDMLKGTYQCKKPSEQ